MTWNSFAHNTPYGIHSPGNLALLGNVILTTKGYTTYNSFYISKSCEDPGDAKADCVILYVFTEIVYVPLQQLVSISSEDIHHF